MHALITVFVAALIEGIGLTALRMKIAYSIPIASVIFGFAVVPLLSIALKYEGIALVNFFWNTFSTILMFLIGTYIFDEKICNLQIVGVLISLLGIFLILIAPDL
jgi:multidrug transporter EmrE-like cation transporter